jgi:hypothetical protein
MLRSAKGFRLFQGPSRNLGDVDACLSGRSEYASNIPQRPSESRLCRVPSSDSRPCLTTRLLTMCRELSVMRDICAPIVMQITTINE